MENPQDPQAASRTSDPAAKSRVGNSATRSRLRWWIKRLLRFAVLPYSLVCLGVACIQDRLLFYPTKQIEWTPGDLRLLFEEVQLTTSDGLRLHGWFVPHPDPLACILFFHGNGGNIGNYIENLKIWSDMGFSSFIIDYRGYGLSEGHPSEAGLYRDAEAAWIYLTQERGLSPGRIIIFGRSLGGAVAIELASRHTPAILVVESSFTSIIAVGQKLLPLLPVRLMTTYRFDSLNKIVSAHCPVLITHGEEDQLIPLSHAHRLYERANPPKHLMLTPGDHNESGYSFSNATQKEFVDLMTLWLNRANQASPD